MYDAIVFWPNAALLYPFCGFPRITPVLSLSIRTTALPVLFTLSMALIAVQARIARLDATARATIGSRLANVARTFACWGHASQRLSAEQPQLHASLLRMAVTGRKPANGCDVSQFKEMAGGQQ